MEEKSRNRNRETVYSHNLMVKTCNGIFFLFAVSLIDIINIENLRHSFDSKEYAMGQHKREKKTVHEKEKFKWLKFS